MRRLVRYALIVCAALPLALCGVCVLLQMTGLTGHAVLPTGARAAAEVYAYHGKAFIGWRAVPPYRPAWAGQVNRYGFRYTRWSDGSGEVGMPLWLAAAIFGLTGVGIVYLAWPARAVRAAGRCTGCGYDLRATPDRCPECGRIAAAPQRLA